MKAQTVISDAAHMLVSAQNDIVNPRSPRDKMDWANGYYQGRRSAARFVLRHAAKERGGKRAVASAIREWVAYFRADRNKRVLPTAV